MSAQRDFRDLLAAKRDLYRLIESLSDTDAQTMDDIEFTIEYISNPWLRKVIEEGMEQPRETLTDEPEWE